MKKAGMKLPAPWLNVPKVQSRYKWYFDAFGELTTCRQFGMGAAPIPWTAIVEYIDRNEIEDEQRFFNIIRAMDSVYLSHIKQLNEKG